MPGSKRVKKTSVFLKCHAMYLTGFYLTCCYSNFKFKRVGLTTTADDIQQGIQIYQCIANSTTCIKSFRVAFVWWNTFFSLLPEHDFLARKVFSIKQLATNMFIMFINDYFDNCKSGRGIPLHKIQLAT